METSKENMGGMGGILGILFIILVIWLIFGGGMGGFGRNAPAEMSGCGRVSNCEAVKQEMQDNFQSILNTINQGMLTRETVIAGNNVTQTKIDFYAYQGLRDQLAEEQRQNMMLQNQIYSNGKFNEIEKQLCCMSNRMAVKPEIFSTSVACPSNAIFNNGCGGCFA